MGKPNLNHNNPALGVFIEITCGISALRMEPKPIPVEKADGPFICDRDEWAKHSIEHFDAASQNLINLQNELRRVHALISKNEVKSSETIEAMEILENLI